LKSSRPSCERSTALATELAVSARAWERLSYRPNIGKPENRAHNRLAYPYAPPLNEHQHGCPRRPRLLHRVGKAVVLRSSAPAPAGRRGCRTKPRRPHWSLSKGGVRRAETRFSDTAPPVRQRRAQLLQRPSQRTQPRFSQTTLCDSLRPERQRRARRWRRPLGHRSSHACSAFSAEPGPAQTMVPPLVGSSSKRMAFSRPRAACHPTLCQATWAGRVELGAQPGARSAWIRSNPLSIEVSVPTTVHWRGRRSTRLRRSRSVVGHLETRVPALVRVCAESYVGFDRTQERSQGPRMLRRGSC
jgi:hypothetical protein